MLLLHTDYGRELVRIRIESKLGEAFASKVRVGRVGGSLLSDFSVEDISIEDAAGRNAILLDRVDVEYSPWKLISRTVEIEELSLRGLRVHASRDAAGVLNLATLMRAASPKGKVEREPSAWRVLAPKIVLSDSEMSFEDGDTRARATEVAATASVRFVEGRVAARLEGLAASVQPPAEVNLAAPARPSLPLSLEGNFSSSPGAVALDSVVLSLGGARAEAASLMSSDSGEMLAEANLYVPASVVHQFDSSTALLADVRLNIDAKRDYNTSPIDFRLTGSIGTSPLSMNGKYFPEAESAEIHLTGKELDTRSLWRGLASSQVNVTVDAKTKGFDIADAIARAELTLAGTVDKVQLGILKLDATLEGGIADAILKSGDDSKWIRGTAKVDLEGQEIVDSDFHLEHGQIQALAWGYSDARGDVRLDARASGSFDALETEGSLTSQRFSALGNRARGLEASWNGTLGEGAYNGRLEAKAGFVRAGSTAVGSVKLDVKTAGPNQFQVHLINRGPKRAHYVNARTRFSLAPKSTIVDIDRVELATRGLAWHGNGGRIVKGGRGDITFENIALDSKAGHLDLDGTVELDDGLSSGDIALVARDVDLGYLSEAFTLEPALSGRASLRATLKKSHGRAARGKVLLSLQSIASAKDTPPTSGTIDIRLNRRKLIATAELRAEGVGTASLAAEALAPRNPTAPRGWKRFDQRALVSASVHTSTLKLEALSRFSPELPSAGTIAIDGQLGNGGSDGVLVLTANEVVHASTVEPASAEVRLVLEDQKLRLSGDASLGTRARASLLALGHLSGPLLRPSTIARIDSNALQEATAYIDGVDLEWWDQTLELGLQPKDSRVEANLLVSKAIADATLTVRATQDGLDHRGEPQKRESELVARLRAKSIDLKMHGTLDGREAARGVVHLDKGWNTLLSGNERAIAATGISAEGAIVGLPLALIQSVVAKGATPRSELSKGKLVASAIVGGTIGSPKVDAKIHTEDSIITGINFTELRATASYSDNLIVARLTSKQEAGGTLDISSEVDIGVVPSTQTRVHASNWDLGFLKSLIPERSIGGLLSANVDVVGALDAPSITGTAHLKKGSVHPGAPLYSLRELDVEVALTKTGLTLGGSGEAGRGNLSLDGHVVMKDFVPSALRLNLESDGVPVDAGPLSVFVDTKTTVRGTSNGENWRFDVDVGDTIVNVPGERSRTLHPDQLPSDIVFVNSIHEPPSALVAAIARTPATVVDVYIKAPDSIEVRGEAVQTIVDVDLHARIASDIVVEGTVATRGGWLELFGRRYDMRHGDISFGGDTNPALDIELGHDFATTTLTIAVSGTGAQPELALRATPSRYDDAELLAFVLGADPDDDPTSERSTADRATGAASNFVASQLQSVIRDVVPIDVLKIELAEDEAVAEQLTLGTWITDKILLAYRRRFEAENLENANEAVIEYRFRRRWLLEFSYGDQGTGGGDVLWIRRF
ncbi:MAG: hypothetical protein GY811_02255 [Myxococcales bacterium]|nr:hypothetical protein [Myxococcales bacterium]